jgi:hypothetical protein
MNHVTLSPWVGHVWAWLWPILKGSWQFLASVGVSLLLFLGFLRRRYASKSISVGLPFNLGSWTYDTTPSDRIVAWKLYVQLATRKAALLFDEKFDVISEVYDSLSTVFGVTRELLLELPAHEFERESGVAPLLLRVINDGLRPHLTQWQSEFRRWWEDALKSPANQGKSPQEVQRQYLRYAELVSHLIQTNTELSKLSDELLTIARARKHKQARPPKVSPLPPTPESVVEKQAAVDYRIEPNGTVVVLESMRATQRGRGPKPQQGARLAFRTKHDTAEFVRAGEAEGFTFQGKEFMAHV